MAGKECCSRCGCTTFKYVGVDITAGVVWEETAYCVRCGYYIYYRHRDMVDYAPVPNILVRAYYRVLYYLTGGKD